MKKTIASITAVLLLSCLSAGCEKKASPKKETDVQPTTQAAVSETTALSISVAPTVSTTASAVTSAASKTSSASSEKSDSGSASHIQADPLGGGAFSYNESGAVVFAESNPSEDDSVLISAAQALFKSACLTQWDFTCGCIYNTDYESYVQNEFGWTFYKITDEGINSIDDILEQYHKVFSDRFPAPPMDIYTEQDGNVYMMSGGRGAHLYYSASKITDIQSKSDDEIVFTVENYYDRSDFDDKPYTETDTFSAVIDGDTWYVGQFTMPY